MINRLNTLERAEVALVRIAEFLDAHVEWFCTIDGGATEALTRCELEVRLVHGRLVLNCWTDKGIHSWKIFDWELNNQKLLLQASRRMGAERPLIELVPRASAAAIALTVKTARQARCDRLGELVRSFLVGSKLERCAVSPGARRGQPGRYARIILRKRQSRLAVTGTIASSLAGNVDSFLAGALLWFKRTSERIRSPYIDQLWLIVEGALAKPLRERVALLRQGLQDVITVFEVDDELNELKFVDIPARPDLWKKRLSRFPPTTPTDPSEVTRRLIDLAPDAIDVVYARHGHTLRYFGMPFVRVRRVMDEERVWFGIEGARRELLSRESENECISLLADLMEHRSAATPDQRHALYRNAAESWLESLLRRDITRLDPGLIVAPLHAQFRISRGGVSGVRPIDLLALRHDGRLAVIELKVSEAREHVFQGADYWQRVEAHRRRGHITRAKLFGDRNISNDPPLIYLVAPTLRVHPAFNTLARMIAPDIEIFRFDINEDWRFGVRVMRRVRVVP